MQMIIGVKNTVVDGLAFNKVSKNNAFGVCTTYKQVIKWIRSMRRQGINDTNIITWYEGKHVVLYAVFNHEHSTKSTYIEYMCGNGGTTTPAAMLALTRLVLSLPSEYGWDKVYWNVYAENTHARKGYDAMLRMAERRGYSPYCIPCVGSKGIWEYGFYKD